MSKEKIVIVHPELVEADHPAATQIQQVIAEAEQSGKKIVYTDDIPLSPQEWGHLAEPQFDADILVLREDNTVYLQDCIEAGDLVTIYGAYREICVRFAAMDAE